MKRALALSVCIAGFAALPAAAQSLAQRVAAAPGDVRMTYAARADVCGHANGWVQTSDDDDWRPDCQHGPVHLTLLKQRGDIVAVRARIGGSWQRAATGDDAITDLGDVPAAAASELLLDLAASAAPSVAEDAIMPAVIAAVPDPWQRLLDLARNRRLDSEVREQATFWLGQSAAREATAGLAAIVDEDESIEVQKAAVFALSQRDEPERIATLIGVARHHANREVVRAAFFWLAESEDARAVDFFEDVLTN